MRRSRKCALASVAARSQAGLWRAVLPALEQRVGSHSAVSGCPGSVVVTRLSQSAVAGSYKQSARGPPCRVRATLASPTARTARAEHIEGKRTCKHHDPLEHSANPTNNGAEKIM